MPVLFVAGDPLLSRAHALAIGHNAKGKIEVGKMETALSTAHPAAFAGYRRQAHKGRITAGHYWIWREATPLLIFMTVRESGVGATRLRHVQSVTLNLVRDYRLEGIKSLAIAPLGRKEEYPEIKKILNQWYGQAKLPVVVYETYEPGVQADESIF